MKEENFSPKVGEYEVYLYESQPVVVITGKPSHGKGTFARELSNRIYEDMGISNQIIELSTSIQEKAKALGWSGKKDRDGRLILQLVTLRGERQHGVNYFIHKSILDRIDLNKDLTICTGLWSVRHMYYFKKHFKDVLFYKIKRYKDPEYREEYETDQHKIDVNPYDVTDDLVDFVGKACDRGVITHLVDRLLISTDFFDKISS